MEMDYLEIWEILEIKKKRKKNACIENWYFWISISIFLYILVR